MLSLVKFMFSLIKLQSKVKSFLDQGICGTSDLILDKHYMVLYSILNTPDYWNALEVAN